MDQVTIKLTAKIKQDLMHKAHKKNMSLQEYIKWILIK